MKDRCHNLLKKALALNDVAAAVVNVIKYGIWQKITLWIYWKRWSSTKKWIMVKMSAGTSSCNKYLT